MRQPWQQHARPRWLGAKLCAADVLRAKNPTTPQPVAYTRIGIARNCTQDGMTQRCLCYSATVPGLGSAGELQARTGIAPRGRPAAAAARRQPAPRGCARGRAQGGSRSLQQSCQRMRPRRRGRADAASAQGCESLWGLHRWPGAARGQGPHSPPRHSRHGSGGRRPRSVQRARFSSGAHEPAAPAGSRAGRSAAGRSILGAPAARHWAGGPHAAMAARLLGRPRRPRRCRCRCPRPRRQRGASGAPGPGLCDAPLRLARERGAARPTHVPGPLRRPMRGHRAPPHASSQPAWRSPLLPAPRGRQSPPRRAGTARPWPRQRCRAGCTGAARRARRRRQADQGPAAQPRHIRQHAA